MKFYGDIPEDHIVLLLELQQLEAWFEQHGDNFPLLSQAKGLTAMSHDYFSMEMEEEGERLLKKANKICPGYFVGPILSQIDKDNDFRLLIKQLVENNLSLSTLVELGFACESL